jgi:uncharacterized protein (DUF4415 family)
MARTKRIERYSAEAMTPVQSEADRLQIDAMARDEVARLADQDDALLPTGWKDTIVIGRPEPKKDVHLRLDPAVLRWFKAHGPGYQSRINAVLRALVQSRQRG